MKELLSLFLLFAKIGAFTFGGGYAMLPMIKRELVEKRNYATEEEVLDYYAIGQLTPGVIAVNVATFIGYKRKGVAGGVMATLGVVFPSVVIITIIAALITNFQDIPVISSALSGIRIAVVAMILKTLVGIAKKGIKDIFTFIVAVTTFLVMLFGLPAAFVSVASILVGITYKSIKEGGKKA
jgi:chromate transporter